MGLVSKLRSFFKSQFVSVGFLLENLGGRVHRGAAGRVAVQGPSHHDIRLDGVHSAGTRHDACRCGRLSGAASSTPGQFVLALRQLALRHENGRHTHRGRFGRRRPSRPARVAAV